MSNVSLDYIVKEVIDRVKKEAFIEVEASGRHIHLCQEHIEILFGKDYTLNKLKDLSQPGQYACKERVTITGAKGSISNVVVLGPARPNTQVEVSLTDALSLGLKIPVKESGDIEGTPGIVVSTEKASIEIQRGLIVAKRHIHITPEDAEKFNVKNNEIVKVEVLGNRPLIFGDTVIRVSPKFRTYMHIDYDEANACGFTKGTLCRIIK